MNIFFVLVALFIVGMAVAAWWKFHKVVKVNKRQS